MPRPKAQAEIADPLELIGRAIAAFDAQIAELQAKRDLLARFAHQPQAVAAKAMKSTATPPKARGMSAEAKAKISAAAKKRWAKKRKADAAIQQEATSKAAPVKAKAAVKKPKQGATKKVKAVKSAAPDEPSS